MELDVTFKSVCESLKKGAANDSKLIEAVDILLGLTILCAPVALGPAGLGLISILSAKNELTKVGRRILDTATKKQGDDYFARLERMRTAHGLLVYTAFFDALDGALPDDLRKKIDLCAEEKRVLAAKGSAAETPAVGSTLPTTLPATSYSNPLAEVSVAFPHPTQSIQEQTEAHQELWRQLSEGFWRFLPMLAVWDELKDGQRNKLREILDGIPQKTARIFVAQYLELSRKFPDFAIWANLHQHATTQTKLSKLASHVTHYIDASKHSLQSVDLGLAKLHETIAELRREVGSGEATSILDGLGRHYAARLDDLVIEDKDFPGESGPKLRFPKVRDAYVPQQFRVLWTKGNSLHLEDEKTWSVLPTRDDLGPFLISHLLSPYSAEAPLLILGHPGSGKSLLTKVLAAQLATKNHSVVRVPLREVDADGGIVAQIEDTIGQITKRRVDSWATLSSCFKDHPPVIILDGYDELLQASGKVYAGYLRDANAFQKSESEQGRPVRIIVTSRVTLIDKAMVPPGTTVLRLLEFDERRQQKWISVWNAANAVYFREAKVDEFRLPEKSQPGAEKILALAEQPLLLLMLALYDSKDNQLRVSVALDRTRLYDALLRRFVKRERAKDRTFHDDLTNDQQKAEIDKEMRRLGVAAIGMYNRRQVHILAEDLGADLEFFDMVKDVVVTEGRPMRQADLLLGSFFFVHKSQAKRGDSSAFEFLHNTLGEFLTADFILRWAIDEVQALSALRSQQHLQPEFHTKMNSPDGLRRQWFASLVYTPLFTRPVVLEMMREWSGHLLEECGMSRDEFANYLDLVLHNQIERLISKRSMPSIMRDPTVAERFRARFGDHPLVGHIAVYSLNLVLLRVIVCERPFIMDEQRIESYEDGARPWDRLVHLWRSWFSLEVLNGLTAVIESVRKGSIVEVKAKSTFQVAEARGRLDVLLNVSLTIADDLTAAVAGLAYIELAPSQETTQVIAKRLSSERIDATFQIAVRELQDAARRKGPDVLEFAELIRRATNAMQIAVQGRPRDDAERVALLFSAGVREFVAGRTKEAAGPSPGSARLQGWPSGARVDLGPAVNMGSLVQLIDKSPEAALTWVKALKLVGGPWVFRGPEVEEIIARFIKGPGSTRELLRERAPSLVAWIGVLRELGLTRWPHPRLDRFLHPRMMLELLDHSPETALAILHAFHEPEEAGRLWLYRDPEIIQYLLAPSYLFEVAERSPEAAGFLARLLRSAGEGLLLSDMGATKTQQLVRAFVERASQTSCLFDLAGRSPEAALEFVRLVRTLGGSEALDGPQGDTLLDQFSDRRFLIKHLERNLEWAVATVQLLWELAGDLERFWRHVEPEVVLRLLDPRHVLMLAERSPEAATFLTRLLRGWLDVRKHHHLPGKGALDVMQKFIQRAIETPYLFELMDRSPSAALEITRLICVVGRNEVPEALLHHGLMDRLADRSFLLRLSEKNPETAVAMVELLSEVGSASVRMGPREGSHFAEHLLDPAFLLELAERSPESALILTKVGGALTRTLAQRPLGSRFWEPARVAFALQNWLNRPARNPRGFASALFLARQLHSPDLIRPLAEAVALAVNQGTFALVVPLAVYDDLRWLANCQQAQDVRASILSVLPSAIQSPAEPG